MRSVLRFFYSDMTQSYMNGDFAQVKDRAILSTILNGKLKSN